MIYTQVFLKGLEYVPLKLLVSDKRLYSVESARSAILSHVGIGVRGVTTLTTLMQLKSAWALKDGLYSLTNTPSMIVSLGNTAVDLGYWAHHQYKISRGEGIEAPSHYLVQEGISAGLDTLGTMAFVGMITGDLSWLAWAAGALYSAVGVHHVRCEATQRDTTSKALIAACNNISYYRNLQATIQYINTSDYKLIQQVPTEACLAKVKSRADILFRKDDNTYYIYCAGEEDKSARTKKIIGRHKTFFSEGMWPAGSESMTIKDESQLAKIKYIAKDLIISEPIVKEYTASVPYWLLKGSPSEADIELIIRGEKIIFSEETVDEITSHHLYLKNQSGKFDNIIISLRLPCFDLLLEKTSHQILPTDAGYGELSEFATGAVISQRLTASNNNIAALLELVFGGFGYVNNNPDQEAANFARIVHLYQKIKDLYDQKNYAAVLHETAIIGSNSTMVINNTYKLPPHLAWQIILYYRLTTLIESVDKLREFRDEFQNYSKYIYDAANESKPWYCTHWETVKQSLEKIVEFAMQQFIVAASKATTAEDKLLFLSFITKSYNYCDNWYDILKSDEQKFWAASIYLSLDKKEECKLFFDKIKDLNSLIKSKNDGEFTGRVLALLEDINSLQHNDILLSATRGEFTLGNEALVQHVLGLIDKNKLTDAARYLETSGEFQGKSIARAYYLFTVSKGTNIMGTLRELFKEASRPLDFWRILDSVISKCLDSTKYTQQAFIGFRANAKLLGWRKICLDNIQRFNLGFEDKIKTDKLISYSLYYIEQFIRWIGQQDVTLTDETVKKCIDEWMDLGHQIILGENNLSLISEIEGLLHSVSFSHMDGDEINKYTPFDVPADGDCGFHIFGITRKQGIDLLSRHVKSQRWVSKVIFGDNQREDIINMLLDDLECKNDTQYERSKENFANNLILVEAYLQSLSQPGVFLPHNQNASSVMDALALLLSKNLRIFMLNEEGMLSVSSSNIHHPSFETIDVLFTSAVGEAQQLSDLNHYVRLGKLPVHIIEMRETASEDETLPATEGPALPRVSKQSIFTPKQPLSTDLGNESAFMGKATAETNMSY